MQHYVYLCKIKFHNSIIFKLHSEVEKIPVNGYFRWINLRAKTENYVNFYTKNVFFVSAKKDLFLRRQHNGIYFIGLNS